MLSRILNPISGMLLATAKLRHFKLRQSIELCQFSSRYKSFEICILPFRFGYKPEALLMIMLYGFRSYENNLLCILGEIFLNKI